MSYIEDNLRPNEEIHYLGKLSWFSFIYPLIMGFFVYLINDLLDTPIDSIKIVLVCMFFFLYRLVLRLTSEFAITNERVMIKYGLIFRTTFDLTIQKIEGYTANQSILGRIINYGTITLQGSGGTKHKIKNLTKPLEFRDGLYDAIEMLKHPK